MGLRVDASRTPTPGRFDWEGADCEADSCVDRRVSEACIGPEIHLRYLSRAVRDIQFKEVRARFPYWKIRRRLHLLLTVLVETYAPNCEL